MTTVVVDVFLLSFLLGYTVILVLLLRWMVSGLRKRRPAPIEPAPSQFVRVARSFAFAATPLRRAGARYR